LVSEQAGQDKEGQWHQKPTSPAADGPGPVQPQHGHGY